MKKIAIVYLAGVHALLAVALLKTDLIDRVEAKLGIPTKIEESPIIESLRHVHRQIDSSVPDGAAIFLGDSITMGLATAAVAPQSVNYGIGWQRSDQLIESMKIYDSIKRAKLVFVTIGTNDILQGKESGIEARYRTILSMIPPNVSVVMSSAPPLGDDVVFYGRKVDSSTVRNVVSIAKSVCEADKRCKFVNTYDALNGKPGVLMEDKIHLTPKGYRIWIEQLKKAI